MLAQEAMLQVVSVTELSVRIFHKDVTVVSVIKEVL